MAPLPRAYQWADGSAYINHVELARKARGAELPASFATDPLMYQGGSDSLLGACDPIEVADESWGIDLEGEIAVILGDVPMGVSVADALAHVRLVALVNDVSLRNLIPAEIAKGFGFFHGKPSSAFSPVAVTPDELGEAWHDGKVHLPLLAYVNGELIGRPNAGQDMTFSFRAAHCACRQDAAFVGRHDPGLRHGIEQRRGRRSGQARGRGRRGLHMPRRGARRGDAAPGQAAHAVLEIRRSRAHRDAGCGGAVRVRGDRSAGCAA